eukprot:5837009-Ditylum_brightwellii.AAC.1
MQEIWHNLQPTDCTCESQYHVVFDDEFSTVSYFQSDDESPNWANLVAEQTGRATDEVFNITSSWHKKKENQEKDHEGTKESDKVREQQTEGFVDINGTSIPWSCTEVK